MASRGVGLDQGVEVGRHRDIAVVRNRKETGFQGLAVEGLARHAAIKICLDARVNNKLYQGKLAVEG